MSKKILIYIIIGFVVSAIVTLKLYFNNFDSEIETRVVNHDKVQHFNGHPFKNTALEVVKNAKIISDTSIKEKIIEKHRLLGTEKDMTINNEELFQKYNKGSVEIAGNGIIFSHNIRAKVKKSDDTIKVLFRSNGFDFVDVNEIKNHQGTLIALYDQQRNKIGVTTGEISVITENFKKLQELMKLHDLEKTQNKFSRKNFYIVKGEIDPEKIGNALADLKKNFGDKNVELDIQYAKQLPQ